MAKKGIEYKTEEREQNCLRGDGGRNNGGLYTPGELAATSQFPLAVLQKNGSQFSGEKKIFMQTISASK